VQYNYFGNDQWADVASGLKTLEDALHIRRQIFLAFEAAEREPDPEKRRAWLTFVLVGAGPTGVELAGTLGELAHKTLKDDFRHINTTDARIILVEAVDRVLPPFPSDLSAKAAGALAKLGVTIRTKTKVTAVEDGAVTIQAEDGTTERIPARTILWAAGVKASPLSKILAERTEAELDRAGRVIVESDLSIAGHPDIFVIGDLAHFAHQGDKPLPGVAQVAMQGGDYVARLIKARLAGRVLPPFRYHDKGNLAVIGRNAAVADLGWLRLSGFPAWIIWIFIHLYYLIEYDNRLLVLVQWAWNYFTRKRGARLITGSDPFPLVEADAVATTARSQEKAQHQPTR
jgi:NADH dehydrogenase